MLELPIQLLHSLPSLSITAASGVAGLSVSSGSYIAFDGTAIGVAPTLGGVHYTSNNVRVEFIGATFNFGFGTPGLANQFQFNATATGVPPALTVVGTDPNIGLQITTKGSGTIRPSTQMDYKTDGNYTDNSGTPGNTTISKVTGRAAIASAASSCVVTNTLVSTTSIVLAICETTGVGVADLVVVPGAGSFTVTSVNATGAPTVTTGALKFSFVIFNT